MRGNCLRRQRCIPPRALFFLAGVFLALHVASCRGERVDSPRMLDERLEMTLVASDPDIVTPIGLAIDGDRLYVLESHTHLPPSDYDGPDGDYVKILSDDDGDGVLEVVGVFARGFEDGMNLAFSPEGVLHLVTSRTVWALYDRDGDGVSEDRKRLLHMDRPDYVYDHAGLLGIAFSQDGWMYVSRGNVGGQAWRLRGTDDSTIEGYGDGGNIVRARSDGSELQEMATGFWNPFDLFVDAGGRLMATDNDPDSRGPNRLLHIIQGGDYGYESLYGGSGIHPYLAWNGELPGTLPYAAGLGEAPTGCIETPLAGEAEHALLCAIWEESSIVRVRLSPHGVSVRGEVDPVIEGGAEFRPVAMAAAPDGSIYLTDWVLRRYPSHGRGRIWRIAAHNTRQAAPRPTPPDAARSTMLDELYAANQPADFPLLRSALMSHDPFIRTAAITALTRPTFLEQVVAATEDTDADVRLGALLALRRAGDGAHESIARRLLSDPDPRVLRMALIWIGKAGMTSLRSDVEQVVNEGMLPPSLFDTYLATLRHLDPSFVTAYRDRVETSSGELRRSLPDGFIETFAADTTRTVELRAAALAYVENPAEHFDLLESLARGPHEPLRLSAVRVLARTGHPDRSSLLLELADDPSNPADLRAESVLGLSSDAAPRRVADLLNDREPAIRLEAARHLRGADLDEELRNTIEELYASVNNDPNAARLAEQLGFLLGKEPDDRPESFDEWRTAAAEGGDPAVGRRVFFWTGAQCSQCHRVAGLGGDLGPDLTNVGASKTRAQLVRAIVDPSEEVAPDWQGWYVRTADGQVHYGRQIDVGSDDVKLFTLAGRFVEFDDPQEWGVTETSLMPEGLQHVLSVHDFRDLVAFLEQNK